MSRCAGSLDPEFRPAQGGRRPPSALSHYAGSVWSSSASDRAAALAAYHDAHVVNCERCPLSRDAYPGRDRQRRSERRRDVRRRGARDTTRIASACPFVGQAGEAARQLLEGIGLTRAGRLRRQRAQVPATGEPRSAACRDRRLPGPPVPPGRDHSAAADLHARKLRDEAALGPS